MASATQRTWVRASSRKLCRTGKPGVLHYIGLQNWTWLSDWVTTAKLWPKLFIRVQVFGQHVFLSLCVNIYEWNGWIILYVNFTRNCWTILKSSSAILHSHQKHVPRPQSYVSDSVFKLHDISVLSVEMWFSNWVILQERNCPQCQFLWCCKDK